ncbi:MAG: hypothetical protein QY325_12215 [Flavobacteriales bacterium]|jgi:hypothetical protein|nr:MAG: hypothetical protein QY325_12215 [Flavobacteriales bacterium]
MEKHFLLALAGLLALPALHAQDEGAAARPLIAEAYAAGLGFTLRESSLPAADWRSMLPASSLLREELPVRAFDYPWYGPEDDRFDDAPGMSRSSGGVYLGIGLDLDRAASSEARFTKLLRIAVAFGGGQQFSSSWGRSTTAVYDTLVSLSTGDRYELDSTWAESYIATVTRSRMAVDASFILSRNARSRFSWFVGGGLQLGFAHDARATVWHGVTTRLERHDGSDETERTTIAEESFRLDPALSLTAYGVVGIDFRLGRTSPFWSGLHLFSEVRPMLHAGAYPGLPARWSQGTQQLFGLRVDIR